MTARGIYNQFELWRTRMQSIAWQWKVKDSKTGEEKIVLVQGALRPSVLGTWEYIIPEDCLAECLAVLGIAKPHGKGQKIRDFGLRKILGLKSIPKKIWDESKKIQTNIIIDGFKRGITDVKVPGVSVHIHGIKKDDFRDFEDGHFHEAL